MPGVLVRSANSLPWPARLAQSRPPWNTFCFSTRRQTIRRLEWMSFYAEEIENEQKPATIMPERVGDTAISVETNRKTKRVLTAVLLIAIASGMGIGFWSLSRQLAPQLITTAPASSKRSVRTTLPEKSIAVLPFENLSEDKQNAFFADGVQDDILTALSKVADLKVINRTSVNTYAAGRQRNLSEIAQSLGVAYVLEGNVRRSGQNVSITAHLTDARTTECLWAESYQRDLAGVFAIHSEIVQRITSLLHANVTSTEQAAIEERPTKDLGAYGLYVRAKALI